MNKILRIIQWEYLRRVRKKSFILITLLLPVITVAVTAVPLWLGNVQEPGQQTVAIVDLTSEYANAFNDTPEFHFIQAPALMFEMASDDSGVDAVVNIVRNGDPMMPEVSIYSHGNVRASLCHLVDKTINDCVRKNKLQATGIQGIDKIVEEMTNEVQISTREWDENGRERDSNVWATYGAGFLYTFLIYTFLLTYGTMVMQSVTEEKTGRIVEIMVSSVHPFQLMMGKITGIMLVGFTQMAIWALAFCGIIALSGGAKDAIMAEVLEAVHGLPLAEFSIMFVLMFLGGYLLYASFYAAVGSCVNEMGDSSQYSIPVVLVMAFALCVAMTSMEDTNGSLAFWCSLFPFTSPVVMMVRIPFGVPLWQEALSVALLYATAIFVVWIGSKIYRIGIMMYGKKPSISEILKWIRY